MTPTQKKLVFAGLSLLIALVILAVFYGSYLARDLAGGVYAPYQARADLNPVFPVMGVEWPMRPLHNPGDRLPRGLEPGDFNADGRLDVLTAYRSSGTLRAALNPSKASAASGGWPGVQAARLEGLQAAGLGDFDGDGAADIVALHADADARGVLSILWGDGAAGWSAPQKLPVDGWPFTRLQGIDLDRDGDDDLLAGGDPNAAPRWFENPGAGRDLSGWRGRDLAAGAPGAACAAGDLDADGLSDLACASPGALTWFLNPGGAAARAPWPGAALYQGDDLTGEGEVVIADLDADGWGDILTHSADEVLWWRGAASGFTLARIPKHQSMSWRPAALVVADLNGDGQPDIAGSSRHQNGALIKNIAAVWWLERTPAGWFPRLVKWGDGFMGIGANNGERWSRLIALDIDGDGDLDLAGLAEEYHRLRPILAAAWFENPLR